MAASRPWWLSTGIVSRKHVFKVIYLVRWLSERVCARWPGNYEALSRQRAGLNGGRAIAQRPAYQSFASVAFFFFHRLGFRVPTDRPSRGCLGAQARSRFFLRYEFSTSTKNEKSFVVYSVKKINKKNSLTAIRRHRGSYDRSSPRIDRRVRELERRKRRRTVLNTRILKENHPWIIK